MTLAFFGRYIFDSECFMNNTMGPVCVFWTHKERIIKIGIRILRAIKQSE